MQKETRNKGAWRSACLPPIQAASHKLLPAYFRQLGREQASTPQTHWRFQKVFGAGRVGTLVSYLSPFRYASSSSLPILPKFFYCFSKSFTLKGHNVSQKFNRIFLARWKMCAPFFHCIIGGFTDWEQGKGIICWWMWQAQEAQILVLCFSLA